MDKSRRRFDLGQSFGSCARGTCLGGIRRQPRVGKEWREQKVIAAIIKAVLEIITELIRGEIKKDVKAVDADPVPQSLRDRFLDKYRRMRDESRGVR